ncbi:MAG: hypothetical protein ACLSVD_10560 [Eggerthellaceae bacterium]
MSDSVPCGIVRYTVDDEPCVLFVNRTGCEIFRVRRFRCISCWDGGR